VPGFQRQEIFAIDVRFHFLYLADVDNGGAVDALQDVSIQCLLKFFHGFAHDVGDAQSLNAHIVAGRVYPLDIILVDPGCAAAVLDGEARRLFGCEFRNVFLFQFIKTADGLAADVADQFQQQSFVLEGTLLAKVGTHLVQHLVQALLIDGFENVIKCINFEGTYSVFVVGRQKKYHGHGFNIELLNYLKATYPRHLYVQKYQVGVLFTDEAQGFTPIAGFAYYFDIFNILKPVDQATARQGLIVHYQGFKYLLFACGQGTEVSVVWSDHLYTQLSTLDAGCNQEVENSV